MRGVVLAIADNVSILRAAKPRFHVPYIFHVAVFSPTRGIVFPRADRRFCLVNSVFVGVVTGMFYRPHILLRDITHFLDKVHKGDKLD